MFSNIIRSNGVTVVDDDKDDVGGDRSSHPVQLAQDMTKN
jgi:hypothetical protein